MGTLLCFVYHIQYIFASWSINGGKPFIWIKKYIDTHNAYFFSLKTNSVNLCCHHWIQSKSVNFHFIVSALKLFWVAIRASGDSNFTCPDLFSIAWILLSKMFYPMLHAAYFTPILILGICLYEKADIHYIAVLLFIY